MNIDLNIFTNSTFVIVIQTLQIQYLHGTLNNCRQSICFLGWQNINIKISWKFRLLTSQPESCQRPDHHARSICCLKQREHNIKQNKMNGNLIYILTFTYRLSPSQLIFFYSFQHGPEDLCCVVVMFSIHMYCI